MPGTSAAQRAARHVRAARQGLLDGDLQGAAEALVTAETLFGAAGEEVERSRCLRLRSALALHQGDLVRAQVLADRAVCTAPAAARAAAVEAAARAALASGDAVQAVIHFRRASEDRRDERTPASASLDYVDALLAHPDARAHGAEALALLRSTVASAPAGPHRVTMLLDAVARLQGADRHDLADELAADADLADTSDDTAVSDSALLAAGRALSRNELHAARTHADRARTHALAGRSASRYVAAAYAVAALADAAGERVAAYASLAKGWVTLQDLLGADAGRSAFEPGLLELRRQWGVEDFAGIKAAYEKRCRPDATMKGRP